MVHLTQFLLFLHSESRLDALFALLKLEQSEMVVVNDLILVSRCP